MLDPEPGPIRNDVIFSFFKKFSNWKILLISVFKTEGNLTEYICKVSFEHTIFTEPVPVLNAAWAESMVAPVNSFCPPYTITLPLLYLWPKGFFHGKYFIHKSGEF